MAPRRLRSRVPKPLFRGEATKLLGSRGRIRARPFLLITLAASTSIDFETPLAEYLDSRPECASVDFDQEAGKLFSAFRAGADALANLPTRARWFPKGDAAISATKRVVRCQPSLVEPKEGFSFPTFWRPTPRARNGLTRLKGRGI
jgi:hypothetical protein